MSHRAFTQLTGTGFSEQQTEALFEVYGVGPDSYATKLDLQAYATKDDLKPLATKLDLQAFATKDDLRAFATKDDLQGGLQALELRLTLRVGAMVVAAVAVIAVLDRL